MKRRSILLALAALLLLASAARSADPCYPIPVTEYSPSGLAGCVRYGEGIASTWGGPGAARSDCVWPWTDCQTVSVRSLDTGRTIIVTPIMFCDCYQRPGPNGETTRIIDLDPSQIAALGLRLSDGLWRVQVSRIPTATVQETNLPDTAMR